MNHELLTITEGNILPICAVVKKKNKKNLKFFCPKLVTFLFSVSRFIFASEVAQTRGKLRVEDSETSSRAAAKSGQRMERVDAHPLKRKILASLE
jgi:hypothetical protein